MSDYSPVFEKAHPVAKTIMRDPFYFSYEEETAPFGNDDGADTYAGLKEWRTFNKTQNPEVFLYEQIERWQYPMFDLNETDLSKLIPYLKSDQMSIRFMSGIDAAIVAIAFGQLYLEGTIDKDFKKLAMTSIKRELIPQLLELWRDYSNRRKEVLEQMLKDLEIVGKLHVA